MSYTFGQQPVVEQEQVRGHRAKSSDILLQFAPFSDLKANHNCLFMDIQTSTPLVNYFHRFLLSQLSLEDIFMVKTLPGVFSLNKKTTVRGALRYLGPIISGFDSTNYKPTYVNRRDHCAGKMKNRHHHCAT